MRKKDELSKEHTCMQRAHPEEMVFVLLSRDAAAPVAIRSWVSARLLLGKNVETDVQIVKAIECAQTMERDGRLWSNPSLARVKENTKYGACLRVPAQEELLSVKEKALEAVSTVLDAILKLLDSKLKKCE